MFYYIYHIYRVWHISEDSKTPEDSEDSIFFAWETSRIFVESSALLFAVNIIYAPSEPV